MSVLIQAAVGKIGKWASGESGDTLEMIERPHGGISFVLVDGQRSGRAAKTVSRIVARKAISDLGEGIRDGAVARAAHDTLYAHKGGKVSATLNILSVDLTTRTLVISRNSRCPVIHLRGDGAAVIIDEPSEPIGVHRGTKPQITELPLVAGTVVIAYTDGLETAGSRSTAVFDVPAAVRELYNSGHTSAKNLADGLLSRALRLAEGRPRDDMSVLVLTVTDSPCDGVRRLEVSLPLSS